MTFVLPSIVVVLMNKIALRISVRANDLTAERAIIASNVLFTKLRARLLDKFVVSWIELIISVNTTTFSKILVFVTDLYGEAITTDFNVRE